MSPESSFHDETHLFDVIFSAHAVLANTFQMGQYLYYPRGENKVSLLWGSVAVSAVVIMISIGIFDKNIEQMFVFMGLIKVA